MNNNFKQTEIGLIPEDWDVEAGAGAGRCVFKKV